MTTTDPTYLQPVDDVIETLLGLDVDQFGRELGDDDAIRATIPGWHPRNDDDGDGDGDGDGGDDGDTDDAGDDAGDDDDTDADDDGPEARAKAAEKAAAAANKALRALQREREEEKRTAAESEGNFEKLYKDEKAKNERLEEQAETSRKTGLAIAALAEAGAKNPSRAVKLMDLDDVDDEDSALAAAKRLKRSDSYLFGSQPTRQRRRAGGDEDDDDKDGDDDKDTADTNGRNGKGGDKPKPVGVQRLRSAYGKSK